VVSGAARLLPPFVRRARLAFGSLSGINKSLDLISGAVFTEPMTPERRPRCRRQHQQLVGNLA